jgi:hypothetical protein
MPTDWVEFLTPHTMTPDDQSWSRTAFCYAIRCDFPRMRDAVAKLPDGALRDVRLALCMLDAALKVEQQDRVALVAETVSA